MPSNFEFLTPSWSAVRRDAVDAERLANVEPRAAVFHARRALESAVRHLYAIDGQMSVTDARTDGLNDLMNARGFRDALPEKLFDEAHKLRKLGNDAVHQDVAITGWTARVAAKTLHTVLAWAHPVYTPTAGATVPPWEERLLPTPPDAAALKREAQIARARVSELEAQTNAARQTIEQVRSELVAAFGGKARVEQTAQEQRAELAALQAEIERIKTERRAEADRVATAVATADEATTRTVLIDVALARAGWDLDDAKQVRREVDLGDAGRADYVLYGADGLPLATVEAKRAGRDPEAGRTQAERYAAELERRHGRRPIIYWTNGYRTWLYDDRAFGTDGYPPRPVHGFASRAGMETLIDRRTRRRELTADDVRLDRAICDRYYQEEAAKRVFAAYQQRKRKALLVMATGTGKTRTTVGLVDILMRRGWVGRTLFLADRKSLVDQAKKKGFDKYLPDVSTCNLLNEEDVGQRVVFSTYPTMSNAIESGRYGVDAFDLIVVDEAHRSIYQRYRQLLEYFDALLLGLTATPRRQADRDTYGLFELEVGQPTYAYELDQAVADEYLVPPRAASVPVKFLRHGVRYNELSEAERAEYEQKLADPETGDVPGEVDPAELNKFLFNNDTVDKVLAHLMTHGHKVAGGDRLAKTIVFAKNIPHARFIRERFDAQYPHLGGSGGGGFLRVISYEDPAAETLVEQFQNMPMPTIAVSVDMLDTGVDVPEVANLVFFKLVRSSVKFWQMIGRGTRLKEDLFGPGKHKADFRLFDFCGNLEFFEANPKGYDNPARRPLSAYVFDARLDLARAIADLPEGERGTLAPLRAACLDATCLSVAGMNRENYLVRPHLERVERLAERGAWDALNDEDEQAARRELAVLPTEAGAGDDPQKRGFDLLMTRLMLALIERDDEQATHIERVRELAGRLETKRGIPLVATNLPLLAELQTDEWWEAATPLEVERVRVVLRDLVRFAGERPGEEPIYTRTLIDELGAPTDFVDLVAADPSLAGYRRRVEKFLRARRDHPTIRRLIMNEPVTRADVAALETILFSGEGVGGSRERFASEFGARPLGLLVRQVCGLDRNAAKAAFADFLGRVSLTADQIRFVDEIVNRVVNNGFMDRAELRERPFVDLHERSVVGVFPGDDDARALVERVEQIRRHAIPAGAA